MSDKKYYLFLFVPPGATARDMGLELCLLHNTFDFLSDDNTYIADVGFEYSGHCLVMIHMTVEGIDLDEFIESRQNLFLKEKYPRFRLWTAAKGYILSAEATDWEYNKYLVDECKCDVFRWKGKEYRPLDEQVKSVYEKYKGRTARPRKKRRWPDKQWKSNIVVESADNPQAKREELKK